MNWLDYQNRYWKKFLYLENRVIETEHYVAFAYENLKTFSNVYEELLISICSELESVFIEWTGKMNDNANINTYVKEIIFRKEDDFDKEISVFLSDIKINPFSELKLLLCELSEYKRIDTKTYLNWWYNYNKIKHDKTNYYKVANLENVLDSLAALFIVENLRIKELAKYDSNADRDCPIAPARLLSGKFNTKHVALGNDLHAELNTDY